MALHFAHTTEIVNIFLDCNFDLDTRVDDHPSTPAQMRINSVTDVAQLLLDRGAAPDIFLAATMRDLSLVSRIIESNSKSVTYHIVNNSGSFAIGFQGKGGTILLSR